ncbi:hypothetical protein LUZ60_011925 [Juncus effusus]|nr:hypothetical protein LUZ60_011925 [Juncus effusus]
MAANLFLPITPPIKIEKNIPTKNPKSKSTLPNNQKNLSNSSDPNLSFLRYIQCVTQNHFPKKTTLISAIKACTRLSLIKHGESIHAHILKIGLNTDRFVATSIISFYSSFGNLNNAQKVFDEIPVKEAALQTAMLMGYLNSGLVDKARIFFEQMEERDVITWNAMMTGTNKNGRYDETLQLFRQMLISQIKPSEVTLICALSACSQMGSLSSGQWIHSYMQRNSHEIKQSVTLQNSLIHMYSKCGKLEISLNLFFDQKERNLESYNTVLTAFSLHGFGTNALSLFSQILKLGFRPDRITFLALLMACSHSGLIHHAYTCIKFMDQVYGIKPGTDHYGCLIDALSRKGLIQEAKEIIKSMPYKPDEFSLGAILGACVNLGEIELGLETAKKLIEIERYENEGRFIGLINLFNKVGKKEEAVKLRKLVRKRGKNENLGRSSIEIDGFIHEFASGDSIEDLNT